ncbi:hypothetical protein KKB55_01525 [Myxococcota bacterium]|nr:hypothetical protein [Myxococcota bacterium]
MRPVTSQPRYPTRALLDRRAILKMGAWGFALLSGCLSDDEAPSAAPLDPQDAGPTPSLVPTRLPSQGVFYAYAWDAEANAELSWSYALRFSTTPQAEAYCAAHEGALRAELIASVLFEDCQAPPDPAPVEAALRLALEAALGAPPRLEGFTLEADHCAEAALAGEAPGW